MAQILINSRMSAEGKHPIVKIRGCPCFGKIGMEVQWDKVICSTNGR